MTNPTITRRITAGLAGPLVAAGILLGGAVVGGTATAAAQPASSDQCTSMTMTQGSGGTNPNALTRAGQIGAASGSGASDGSMAAACQPASHG